MIRYEGRVDFSHLRGLILAELDLQEDLTTVDVDGPVTRAEVAWWHVAFSEGFARGGGMRIDLAKSGPWDIAGVQLLLAAGASARHLGRPLNWTGVPDVLTALARRAGLLDQISRFNTE